MTNTGFEGGFLRQQENVNIGFDEGTFSIPIWGNALSNNNRRHGYGKRRKWVVGRYGRNEIWTNLKNVTLIETKYVLDV